MKQIKRIFITFSLFMLAFLGFFFLRAGRFDETDRDISYYNDLLYRVIDDYNTGLPKEEIEEKYGCSIILSKEIQDPGLTELYSKGALVLDFAPNGDYIGKVAWGDSGERHERAKSFMRSSVMILWTCVLICGYLLILSVYISLIKPVNEMIDFSSEISKGNLNVPLPKHRHGMFGNFNEAFDLMRLALKESREREIDSEMARKEIVTKLSHDIKTPAAVIKATCEVLELKFKRRSEKKGSPNDDTADLEDTLDKIGIISTKADTISSLMSNMMHSAMNDLEEPDVNVEEEDSRLIEEYFKKLKDYGNIILKNHIPPCLVYMDRLRMEQVIDNIVGNSYKYANTDISVSFTETSDILMDDGSYGRFIKICIRDHGPGAKEEELPLLTEKYYRGSNAASSAGYGLGLYNVKWYMDNQGGGLDYYNDGGFVVELMLRKV